MAVAVLSILSVFLTQAVTSYENSISAILDRLAANVFDDDYDYYMNAYDEVEEGGKATVKPSEPEINQRDLHLTGGAQLAGGTLVICIPNMYIQH